MKKEATTATENAGGNSTAYLWLLAVAVSIRAALLVSGHGFDLGLYMKMGNEWAAGLPPYSKLHYFVYPPFYVYEIGLARLASGGNPFWFATLIKLPLVAADFAAGVLIIKYVLRRAGSSRAAIAAGAAYLLNPLILYNTAYYGRMDQLCTFFAIVALYTYAMPVRSASMLALAACTKTVPVFLYPYFLKDIRRGILYGVVLILAVVVITVPLAALYHNQQSIFNSVFCNIDSTPRGLSFQVIFYKFLPAAKIVTASKVLLLAFMVLLLVFPKRDFLSYCSFVFCAFILFSKAVHEQYATWALPFLIMDYFINGKKRAAWAAAVFTISGLLNAELFGGTSFFRYTGVPQSPYNVLLACFAAWYLAAEFLWLRRAPKEDDPRAA